MAVNGHPPPTALVPSSTASEEEAVTTAAPPVSLVPHQPPLVRGPTAVPRLPGGGGGSSRAAPAAGAATGTGFTDPSSGILKPPLPALVPYEPISTVAMRRGRVVVVIDGPYFERCVRGHENKCVEQYQRTTFALQQALAYIGDLFQMEPIAYWFDTGHEAFTEFLETAMPLHCREAAFRDAAQRRQYLIDEMNSTTGKLSYVVARLVGSMKRQRGYTPDGPGHVWVQSGVDVAMATCLMEHFQDPRLQGCQVVLLSGDSDLYPAVQYCNNLRRGLGLSRVGNPAPQQIGEDGAGNGDQSPLDYTMASSSSASTTAAAAATGVPPPVRMCGTSKSLSKRYGLDQDLFEFLPRILLDEASHTERGQPFQFASHVLFD